MAGFEIVLAEAAGVTVFGGGAALATAVGRLAESFVELPPGVLLAGLAGAPIAVPAAVARPFEAAFAAALAGVARAADVLAGDFLAADFLAVTLPAVVTPARAGAFAPPPPAFPPAGRPLADVRRGFARRFAFAMRPRYLHIQRNVNGAPLVLAAGTGLRLDGHIRPFTMVLP